MLHSTILRKSIKSNFPDLKPDEVERVLTNELLTKKLSS